MQVRIDRDEPIDGAGKEPREVRRRDRFALTESPILAHVRQVRCHESHPGGAQLPRRGGEEEQRQQPAVRAIERAREDDLPILYCAIDPDVRLAIREAADLRGAVFQVQIRGECVGQTFIAW